MQPKNLDPALLMWNIRRRISLERLPARRVVVHFAFSGVPAASKGARRFWLVLERSGGDSMVDLRARVTATGPRLRARVSRRPTTA